MEKKIKFGVGDCLTDGYILSIAQDGAPSIVVDYRLDYT